MRPFTFAISRPRGLGFGALIAAVLSLLVLAVADSARALPPAVQVSPAGELCQENVLPGNDDGSTGQVPIGFTIDFFGTSYDQLYVNNNGNVTFDGPLGEFTPFPIVTTGVKIIAVYFADWDTRPLGEVDDVRYGNTLFNGRTAFCVDYTGSDYMGIGYFDQHTDKRNVHQLVLVERFDTGPGNFDICFNWNQTQWETGDASGGSGGLGGASARVGFSNGSTFAYEEPGSGENGAFLDSNPTGLAYRTNTGVVGRKCFEVRGGDPQVEICDNGIDDDGDGLVDGEDPDCPSDRIAQHFRAYRAMGARATQELMTLVDQFGTEEVRLGSIRILMTPVEKRRQGREPEPIQRPDEHLKCYGITGADQNRTVRVSNQFRDETVVRVRRPSHLCAPAAKTLEGDPGAPPADLNHYKCYEVERTPLIGEDIGLSDQFGPDETVRVLRLIRLCNPVEKRRQGREPEPPPHPTEHLACYQIREPAPFEMRTVFTRDQFRDRETVRVTKPSTLCVPSEKTEQNGT